jgi:membrane protein DedA with SNARE-associated domain
MSGLAAKSLQEAVALVGTGALFLVCRGPGSALVNRLGPRVGLTQERMTRATDVIERRGGPALAIGRGTPGLRTATCVAAGASGLPLRRALPALVIGSSVFPQLHLFLGYFLGQAAGDLIETATVPVIVVLVAWSSSRPSSGSPAAGVAVAPRR